MLKTYTPRESVSYVHKGEYPASPYLPGDFILVADNSFYSRLIRLGSRLRFGKSPYTKWTHAALLTSVTGDLIESDPKGVQLSHLDRYLPAEYLVVHISCSMEDRTEAVGFARTCLTEQYGWVTILSVILSMLTGSKFSFNMAGQEICSGLVARCLERTTAIFPTDPSHISPYQLASYYLG